jgi:hypothetical protein
MRSPRGQSGRREGDNENNHVIVIPSLRVRSNPLLLALLQTSSPVIPARAERPLEAARASGINRSLTGPLREVRPSSRLRPQAGRACRWGVLRAHPAAFWQSRRNRIPASTRFRPDAPYRIRPLASRDKCPAGPAAVAYKLLRTTKGSGEARGSRDSMAETRFPSRRPRACGATNRRRRIFTHLPPSFPRVRSSRGGFIR